MKELKRSFVLLQIEAVITSLVITMPVITLLFNDIGMSQLQVGLSQALFMFVALVFDVPTGWLADRFSRRAVNMLGDLLAGVGFLLYANAQTFEVVLISEAIVGIGLAATNGADVGLLRSYAARLGLNYTRVNAKLSAIKPVAMILGAVFAGWLGAENIRWPFYVSGGLFLLGAVLSLFIVEIGERRMSEKHPLRDMYDIGRYTFRGHEKLRWRIFAAVFSGNLTHTMAFILGPAFLYAGYEPSSLGIVWAVTWAGNSIGALVARRYHDRLSVINQIGIPALLALLSYAVLAFSVQEITVWLFVLFNIVFGWYSAITGPLIQQSAAADVQSTVISFSTVLRRLFYIPLVIIINGLASVDLRLAMLGSFIIYGAFYIVVMMNLRRTEQDGTLAA